MIRVLLRVRVVTATPGVDPPLFTGSMNRGISWAAGNPTSYANSLAVVQDHIAAANVVWRPAGIEFYLPAEITNATLLYANPSSSPLLEGPNPPPASQVRATIGRFYAEARPHNGIRVYYVDTVNRSNGAARTWGGGVITIPYRRGRDGLGHEIGHVLGLGHTFNWFWAETSNGTNPTSLSPFPDDIQRPPAGGIANALATSYPPGTTSIPNQDWDSWEVLWGLNPLNVMSYNKPLGGAATLATFQNPVPGFVSPNVSRTSGFIENLTLTPSQMQRALMTVFTRLPPNGILPPLGELIPDLRAAI